MAATDQFYRSQKKLNRVFAVSCVVMLGTVIWMLVDDYNKEWKKAQRKFRDLETGLGLILLLDETPSPQDRKLARFAVSEFREDLQEKKSETEKDRKEIQAVIDREDFRYQTAKANYTALNSRREEETKAEANAKTLEQREAAAARLRDYDEKLTELAKKRDAAELALDNAKAEFKQKVSDPLRAIEERLAQAEGYDKTLNEKFVRYAKFVAEKKWKAGDSFRNAVILDAFASPTRIQELRTDQTQDMGGFTHAKRIDRCTSCHLAVDRNGYTIYALQDVIDSRPPGQALDELRDALKTASARSAKDEGKLDDVKGDLHEFFKKARAALKDREGLQTAGKNLADAVRNSKALFDVASWERVGAAADRVEKSARRQSTLWDVHTWIAERVEDEGGKKAFKKAYGFDPDDVPEELPEVKLSPGEITQFASHPRLDLFVDSNSPHSMEKFGCTICHEGQGRGTSFSMAEHTPNDALQRKRWEGAGEDGHHWHANHYWEFPMLPKRFQESTCLKCHTQVTDLIRHGSKEEAPKLLEGYRLVKDNGCFGCHEIAGIKAGQTIGPDLRLEPTPPLDWLPINERNAATADPLNPPGALRKVGPSLRRLAEKSPDPVSMNSNEFNPDKHRINPYLLSWIRDPRGFRPDTKMPHFYGQSTNTPDFLAAEAVEQDVVGDKFKDQRNYPNAEIYAIAYYLQTESALALGGEDSTRRIVRTELEKELKKLEGVSAPLQMLREIQVYRDLRPKLTDKRTYADASKALAEEVKKLEADAKKDPSKRQALQKAQAQIAELKKQEEDLSRWIDENIKGKLPGIADKLAEYESKPADLDKQIQDLEKNAAKADYQNLIGLKIDASTLADDAERRRAVSELQRRQAKFKKDLDALRRRYRDLALMSNPRSRDDINKYADALQTKLDLIAEGGMTSKELADTFKEIGAGEESLLGKLRKKAVPEGVQLLKTVPAVNSNLIDSEGKERKWTEVPAVDASRGKDLFTQKGCLACHSHTEVNFPTKDEGGKVISNEISEANFGPELSRIGKKLGQGETGRKWLIQWILNPNVHFPRTRMPITQLQVAEAASIADWLLSYDDGWVAKPTAKPNQKTLQELAEMSVAKVVAIGKHKAEEAVVKGFTDEQRQALLVDADEQLLLEGYTKQTPIDDHHLLRYVGRKAINRQGCFGCHDIPGFENSKPIGTALNDWGRKDGQRLAFEDADAFVKSHFNLADTRDDAKNPKQPSSAWEAAADGGKAYEEIFARALKSHDRKGFLHLKLAEPRSYDYNRLRTWDERLRMPQFKFSRTARRGENGTKESLSNYKARRLREERGDYDARSQFDEAHSREAVMTFILGLVGDQIPAKFVSMPKAEKLAEAKGRQVLEKYNCAGCHEVRSGVYDFNIPESQRASFQAALEAQTEGEKADHIFPESNAWTGRPQPAGHFRAFGVSVDDQPPLRPHPDAETDATKKGQVIQHLRLTEAFRYVDQRGAVQNKAAGEELLIPAQGVLQISPEYGGAFARLIGPHLKENGRIGAGKDGKIAVLEPKDSFNVRANWRAALPPPLLREGERVQPRWLHEFLLEPHMIRPWTTLRMPKFNMSNEEANALVEYFAAVDKLNNPGMGLNMAFAEIPQRDPGFWKRQNEEYVKKGGEAMDVHVGRQKRSDIPDAFKVFVEDLTAQKQREIDVVEESLKQIDKDLPKAKEDEKKILEAEKTKLIDRRDKTLKVQLADIKKKDYPTFEKRWEHTGVYATDAYKLLTDSKSICMTCHSVGEWQSTKPQGPNLEYGQQRLRPDWTYQWIANPNRLTTYPSMMPQNFPKGKKPDPQYIVSPEDGNARDHARAARNAVMNLDEISKNPVNRFRPAPRGGVRRIDDGEDGN